MLYCIFMNFDFNVKYCCSRGAEELSALLQPLKERLAAARLLLDAVRAALPSGQAAAEPPLPAPLPHDPKSRSRRKNRQHPQEAPQMPPPPQQPQVQSLLGSDVLKVCREQ